MKMKFLLLFVIKVIIFNLCDGNDGCKDNSIDFIDYNNQQMAFLLKSNDNELNNLNNKFIEIMKNYNQIVEEISVTNAGIEETRSLIDKFPFGSIINLHVSDFYEHNLSDLRDPYVSVIYNGLESTKEVCVLNVTSKDILPCNPIPFKTKGVMLYSGVFSRNFEEQEEILNILTHSKPKRNTRTIRKLRNIIVCLRNEIKSEYERYLKNSFKQFDINFQLCDRETDINHDTLAVLAPGPLDNTESTTPFVFYEPTTLQFDQEYKDPNKDRFPNSSALLSWKSIAITMIKFLKLMKWRRIAILSDESTFSEIFEKELISMFDKNQENYNVLYGVKQCGGRNCDFKEALTEFHDLDVKIIIANVDETNIKKLLQTAKDINMGHDKHWIFRGHLARESLFNKRVGHYYNIIVQPMSTIRYKNDGYLQSIYNGILRIKNIYDNSPSEIIFGRKIANMQPEDYQIGKVYNQTRKGSAINIATVNIRGNTPSPVLHHKIRLYSDSPSECTVPGETFLKPCSDVYVIYIIVIWVMFLLFTIIILCFFDNLQIKSNNYVNI